MPTPCLSPVRGAGTLVFTSGQLARGDDGAIVPGGFEAQAEKAIANLFQVLADAGCGPVDVVKVTAWLADAQYAPAFNLIYRRMFAEPWPARSTVVSLLLASDALIEIEAVAMRP